MHVVWQCGILLKFFDLVLCFVLNGISARYKICLVLPSGQDKYANLQIVWNSNFITFEDAVQNACSF